MPKIDNSQAYLTIKEAAVILRANPQTIRRYVRQNLIPVLKIGQNILIPKTFVYPPELFPEAPAMEPCFEG